MNKLGPVAFVSFFLAAGGIYFIGGEELEATAVETLRPARLPAETTSQQLAEDCDGGAVLLPDEGAWICLTSKETIVDEIMSMPSGQKRDLLICDEEDPEDGGTWVTRVRYLPSGTLPPKCKLVCSDLLWPGYSIGTVETGVEACLREACDPCQVTAGHWDQCPHCLSDITPSCAETCPAPEEFEP